MSEEFHYLGRPTPRGPSKTLDTFPRPAHVTTVRFTSDELTAVCPITGQPDFYELEIEYAPDGLCLESKSLKLYLWSFRNEGAFAEELAGQIAQHLFDTLQPFTCRVTLTQNVHGGLRLTAVAEIGRDNPGT